VLLVIRDTRLDVIIAMAGSKSAIAMMTPATFATLAMLLLDFQM
jgi:hypothetical protein